MSEQTGFICECGRWVEYPKRADYTVPIPFRCIGENCKRMYSYFMGTHTFIGFVKTGSAHPRRAMPNKQEGEGE